jgi:hypothetical protein
MLIDDSLTCAPFTHYIVTSLTYSRSSSTLRSREISDHLDLLSAYLIFIYIYIYIYIYMCVCVCVRRDENRTVSIKSVCPLR